MADKQEAEMWVDWTRDALRSLDIPDDLALDDEEAVDSLVDDMVDLSTQYADAMLDQFTERFAPDDEARPRRRKKRGRSRPRDAEGDGDGD